MNDGSYVNNDKTENNVDLDRVYNNCTKSNGYFFNSGLLVHAKEPYGWNER